MTDCSCGFQGTMVEVVHHVSEVNRTDNRYYMDGGHAIDMTGRIGAMARARKEEAAKDENVFCGVHGVQHAHMKECSIVQSWTCPTHPEISRYTAAAVVAHLQNDDLFREVTGERRLIDSLGVDPSVLRELLPIQRMHDILWGAVMDPQVTALIGEPDDGRRAALDTLCWVLSHDHNTTFGDNMARLELGLNEAGISIEPLAPLN